MKHIIHFTPEFDNLKKIIISNCLKLHYCKEEFYLGTKKISSAAHPMVSFSEYDIRKIDKENITYGKLGIAFTKSWIYKQKIHPVLYIDKDSIIAQSLASLLIARRKKATEQLSSNIRLSIITIKCFTKNAQGYNSYLKMNNFDFRSENEWRFVPTKKQIGNKLISQDRKKYIAKQDFYNQQLEPYSLNFSLSDIEYIFVETKEQITQIQKIISIDTSRIIISNWTTNKLTAHNI